MSNRKKVPPAVLILSFAAMAAASANPGIPGHPVLTNTAAYEQCGLPICPGTEVLFRHQGKGKRLDVGFVTMAGESHIQIKYHVGNETPQISISNTVVRKITEVAVAVDSTGGIRANDSVLFIEESKGRPRKTGESIGVFSNGMVKIKYVKSKGVQITTFGFVFRQAAKDLGHSTCVKVVPA